MVYCEICVPRRAFNFFGKLEPGTCRNAQHVGKHWGNCKRCQKRSWLRHDNYCGDCCVAGPYEEGRAPFRVRVIRPNGTVELHRHGYPPPPGVRPVIVPSEEGSA